MAITKEEAKAQLAELFNTTRTDLDEEDFLDLVAEFAEVCDETLEDAGYWDDDGEDEDTDTDTEEEEPLN